MSVVFRNDEKHVGLSTDTKPTPVADGAVLWTSDLRDLWGSRKGTFLPLLGPTGITHFQIPTVTGWTETLVGAGSATAQRFTDILVSTTATANASSLLYAGLFGFNRTATHLQWDWDKWTMLSFLLNSNDIMTGCTSRFQLKEAATIGALAAKGIGIRVDALALVGESYGTQLGTVSLGVSIASENTPTHIVIVHDSSVPEIKWYTVIGGVATLRGTQSTAANIPSGDAGATSRLVLSTLSPAGGRSHDFNIDLPEIWQAT